VTLRLRNACSVAFRGVFEAPLCVSFGAVGVSGGGGGSNKDAIGVRVMSTGVSAIATKADLDDDVNINGRDIRVAANREVCACVCAHSHTCAHH
jgi:hypothetical protein